jgi:PLP dependent protein
VITSADVAERLEVVRGRIAAAGGRTDVSIVAVTKGFGVDAIEAALAVGLVEVGENYAQELTDKVGELVVPAAAAPPRFHFIGRLQRNKVRHLARTVAVWQSVDRAELLREIAHRAPGATVLVQLNLSGELQKGGCAPTDAPALVAEGRDLGLDVQGLMGVGPAGPPDAARPGFRQLVALADELDLPIRSMGMSGDLDVAVQEGSTMVRVGTDLFGPRPPRAAG